MDDAAEMFWVLRDGRMDEVEEDLRPVELQRISSFDGGRDSKSARMVRVLHT